MSLLRPILFALLLLSSIQHAAALSLRPLDVTQLTAQAELVIHARVTSQEVVLDASSQRVVTITHFDVIDTIKGATGDTHSIKQLGGHLPGSEMVHRVPGVPRFVDGDEYIVFLPAASRLGFSSPIGLTQGNYRILQRDGRATVSARGLSAARLPAAKIISGVSDDNRGPHLGVDNFKSLLRQLAGER